MITAYAVGSKWTHRLANGILFDSYKAAHYDYLRALKRKAR